MAKVTEQSFGQWVITSLKSEPKCKICKSSKGVEVDELLLLRSTKQKLEDGTRVSGDYVVARMAEWGIENPNVQNVASHLKNHCEIRPLGEAREEEARWAEAAKLIAAEGQELSHAELLLECKRRTVLLELEEGKFPRVSDDVAVKLFAEVNRSKESNQSSVLLEAIGKAAQQALPSGPPAEDAEVTDGRVVGEEVEVEA